MYNMTPSSKVPLDQSRLHTAMLTSCPYYNVKLSKDDGDVDRKEDPW